MDMKSVEEAEVDDARSEGGGGEREEQQVTSPSCYTPPYSEICSGDVNTNRGRSTVLARTSLMVHLHR